MTSSDTSVYLLREAPSVEVSGFHQCPCLQGEIQALSDSTEDAPRQEGGSGSGSYQISAFALGPEVCEILCVPFKSDGSISPVLWDS